MRIEGFEVRVICLSTKQITYDLQVLENSIRFACFKVALVPLKYSITSKSY